MRQLVSGVVHPARLAWQGARTFVAVADSDPYPPFERLSRQLERLLGQEYRRALDVSRTRLLYPSRPDTTAIEAGTWRARLADLLAAHPELAPRLGALVAELEPMIPRY